MVAACKAVERKEVEFAVRDGEAGRECECAQLMAQEWLARFEKKSRLEACATNGSGLTKKQIPRAARKTRCEG